MECGFVTSPAVCVSLTTSVALAQDPLPTLSSSLSPYYLPPPTSPEHTPNPRLTSTPPSPSAPLAYSPFSLLFILFTLQGFYASEARFMASQIYSRDSEPSNGVGLSHESANGANEL